MTTLRKYKFADPQFEKFWNSLQEGERIALREKSLHQWECNRFDRIFNNFPPAALMSPETFKIFCDELVLALNKIRYREIKDVNVIEKGSQAEFVFWFDNIIELAIKTLLDEKGNLKHQVIQCLNLNIKIKINDPDIIVKWLLSFTEAVWSICFDQVQDAVKINIQALFPLINENLKALEIKLKERIKEQGNFIAKARESKNVSDPARMENFKNYLLDELKKEIKSIEQKIPAVERIVMYLYVNMYDAPDVLSIMQNMMRDCKKEKLEDTPFGLLIKKYLLWAKFGESALKPQQQNQLFFSQEGSIYSKFEDAKMKTVSVLELDYKERKDVKALVFVNASDDPLRMKK